MATLPTIIEEVVSRIESITPTLNPNEKYSHQTTDTKYTNARDRIFTIDPILNWVPDNNPSRSPVMVELNLIFHYRKPTEIYRKLIDLAYDIEDLHNNLIYTQGTEWSTSMNVIIEDPITTQVVDNHLVINITLQLHYFRE